MELGEMVRREGDQVAILADLTMKNSLFYRHQLSRCSSFVDDLDSGSCYFLSPCKTLLPSFSAAVICFDRQAKSVLVYLLSSEQAPSFFFPSLKISNDMQDAFKNERR